MCATLQNKINNKKKKLSEAPHEWKSFVHFSFSILNYVNFGYCTLNFSLNKRSTVFFFFFCCEKMKIPYRRRRRLTSRTEADEVEEKKKKKQKKKMPAQYVAEM